MRAALLIFALLVVAVPTQASSAELYLQGRIERTCGLPATPTGIVVHHWKSTCPSDDCFWWRLPCSNGARHELHSAEHPGTTVLEHTFYAWAPWSLALCMVPFLLYSGSRSSGPSASSGCRHQRGLSRLLSGRGRRAVREHYWEPVGNWSEAQRVAFLNPYAFGGILSPFCSSTWPRFAGESSSYFFVHTPHPAYGALMVLADPFQANRAGGPFMPNLYELIDPRQTAEHYRRETELLKAQRDKLDAQRSFAESYLRARRALNASSEEGE